MILEQLTTLAALGSKLASNESSLQSERGDTECYWGRTSGDKSESKKMATSIELED